MLLQKKVTIRVNIELKNTYTPSIAVFFYAVDQI